MAKLRIIDFLSKEEIEALENETFPDFEDCLQSLCAAAFHAEHIITRNEKDYVASEIPAISSENVCRHFLNSGGNDSV